jgi:FKBP-type peptidyl-prolyl cis-trans isomerase FkpA/FKBP-type peptidyl-prolyl cis-trans isomerase FklB
MKRMVIKTVLVAAIGMTACDKKDVKIESDVQKASYGIGTQIGRNMVQNGIEVDSAVLVLGLNDALGKKELRIKPEEIEQAQTKMQEATMKKQTEIAEKNKAEGQAFLEKNKAVAGVQTTATGLQYQSLKEGTGPIPTDKDVVTAHYEGKLINGEKFDSSYDRKAPADFPVTGVIPGWTEALKMMKVGSKWKLVVPPELAYGPSGRSGIPPNSVLVFEVELMAIKGPGDAPADAVKQ